jgi:ABC-type glycerol-3-phosphate transport system permease component
MRNAPPPPRSTDGKETLSPAGMVAAGAGAQLALAAPKSGAPDVAPVGDRSRRLRVWLAYGLMLAYALFMFVPFTWTIITSFKVRADALNLNLIPDPISLAGWQFVFENLEPNIVTLYTNSALIAFAVTVSNLALGSLAGYAFARLRFPGREILFLVVLGTLMIPDQLRVVPVYVLFNDIGLTRGVGQYVAVILVLAISASSIFLLRQYFLTIPRDLDEAAMLDGAGPLRILRSVIVPQAKAAIVAVSLFHFFWAWNEFYLSFIYLQGNDDLAPLSVGLQAFNGVYSQEPTLIQAAAIMAMIVPVAIFFLAQRAFMRGVVFSGVEK